MLNHKGLAKDHLAASPVVNTNQILIEDVSQVL